MNTDNIFELATRNKFRFPFRGMISVEDLWDLTPYQLDNIFKVLNKDVQKSNEDSLLSDHTENKELMTKIEIVKHIFTVKKEEAAAYEQSMKNSAKRQKILEILAKKQDDSLQNKSEEDLLKMLDEIE